MRMLPTQLDKQDFVSFPLDEQQRITALFHVMEKIETHVNEGGSVRSACQQAASECELSAVRLQHVYPDFCDHGWRALIDRKRFPDGESAVLPAEFLRWVSGQFLGNQRKDRPAWRAILRRWRSWLSGNPTMAIPGYNTCPPAGANGRWPTGWSYDNLTRFTGNTKAEQALARVGTSAAMKHLPFAPTTRVGLRPLEYVFFDDVWVDRKAIVPGYGVSRILQLGALDYASGVYLKFGQRPQILNEQNRYEQLKERDMKWLVAMLLEEWGYPLDYIMHLICERGTATLRPADAKALYDLSDGQIQVFFTSMIGEIVQAWDEKAIGNSRGKSPLESWHNLFHNENASLPGQVGMDHEHEPRTLLAQENEALMLTSAAHFMSKNQAARLSLPFSDCREAYFETLETVRRINNRWDHDLEGFEKVREWRINAPGCVTQWKRDIDLFDRATGKSIVAPELERFIEWTSRIETPVERLYRLAAGTRFAKIPFGVLPRFYEDCHTIVHIENYGITFKYEGSKYSYLPPSPEQCLPEGKEYLVYYRPFDLGSIHITEQTKQGSRYIGTWTLQARGNRNDLDAKIKAIAQKRQFLNAAIGSVRNKTREYIQEQEARLANNLQVLQEAKLIPSGDATPLGHAVRMTTETAHALQSLTEEFDVAHEATKSADPIKDQLNKPTPKSAPDDIWI